MTGDLHVTTAHLADLAVKQGKAAAEIRAATFAVAGIDAELRTTHGSIAAATSSAFDAVLAARRSAGTRMAEVSDDLCDKLADAARRYDMVDGALGAAAGAEMQTG
jgi:hypothetical protein